MAPKNPNMYAIVVISTGTKARDTVPLCVYRGTTCMRYIYITSMKCGVEQNDQGYDFPAGRVCTGKENKHEKGNDKEVIK